jgi:hypothetical protein
MYGEGQVDDLGSIQNYADLWYLTNMGIGSLNIIVFGPGSVPTFMRLRGY